MLFDMLIIFIVVAIICLFLTIFMVESEPLLAIPVIFIGMIFSVLSTYGLWDVEYVYTSYNSSIGNTTASVYSTSSYGDPYSYIFMLLFYIYFIFFIRAAWNLVQESLETKGTIDYKKNKR